MRTKVYKFSFMGSLVACGMTIAGCGTAGSPCGQSISTPCANGLFCKLDAGACDDATAVGVCTAIPEVCTEIFSPVCGCDDHTYGNPCEADGAGVNVKHEGACAGGLNTQCGSVDALTCADGFFCQFDIGSCGTGTDGADVGQCQEIPQVCPNIVAPVCGCDNVTYNNECEANRAGVSVQSNGACPTGGGLNVRCGGADALTCTDGSFCMYATGVCSSTTESGQCQQIPEVCPAVVVPVCGCDGMTYNNGCEAMKASVNVLSDGACP